MPNRDELWWIRIKYLFLHVFHSSDEHDDSKEKVTTLQTNTFKYFLKPSESSARSNLPIMKDENPVVTWYVWTVPRNHQSNLTFTFHDDSKQENPNKSQIVDWYVSTFLKKLVPDKKTKVKSQIDTSKQEPVSKMNLTQTFRSLFQSRRAYIFR